ncbi:MAG TPA: hypothetical protein VFA20_20950 [Myxococcaceae bacterium]|nr:hypothetical protein [Myxococcaceae bacterium]
MECEPRITWDPVVGGPGEQYVHLGAVIDSGRRRTVKFDADGNFVVLEVGKRGSGKSFGLGSIMEAFAAAADTCTIAKQSPNRRGVLLLDPLDVHWTAIYPVRKDGSVHMQEQYKLLERFPEVAVEPINVAVYMPAGRGRPEDPAVFRAYHLPVCDLTSEDFALLYGANLVSDPAGMLIGEIHDKVSRLGFTRGATDVPAKEVFGLQDLIDCLQDTDIQANYTVQTLRAVRQRLLSWLRDPLFQQPSGTPVTELVQPGRMGILCLNRLSEEMRNVVTAVIVRRLKADRSRASNLERDRAFNPHPLNRPAGLPRTILAIDEAQMILPATGNSHARSAIESYVLEGRNFGLSIWMATQRPRGAISERAKSQIDTLIVHKLSTAEDLEAVAGLLQSAEPLKIKVNESVVPLAELTRSLDVGMAIVSSGNGNVHRAFVVEMRPRVVAHGGQAF